MHGAPTEFASTFSWSLDRYGHSRYSPCWSCLELDTFCPWFALKCLPSVAASHTSLFCTQDHACAGLRSRLAWSQCSCCNCCSSSSLRRSHCDCSKLRYSSLLPWFHSQCTSRARHHFAFLLRSFLLHSQDLSMLSPQPLLLRHSGTVFKAWSLSVPLLVSLLLTSSVSSFQKSCHKLQEFLFL